MNTQAFDDLVEQSIALGKRFPIMPVDGIQLAVAFAELPDKEQVIARLIAKLFDHPDMHVRRIAVDACRRAGAFDVPGLKDALTRKLEDPQAWVRYDAAWAIQAAGYDSLRIRVLLGRIAGTTPLPELEALVRNNLSDADLQAQARARKTLDALSGQYEG